MRTTVDIPDAMYRRLKSRAAREGSSTRALILKGVKEVLKAERHKSGPPVSLPMVRSSVLTPWTSTMPPPSLFPDINV